MKREDRLINQWKRDPERRFKQFKIQLKAHKLKLLSQWRADLKKELSDIKSRIQMLENNPILLSRALQEGKYTWWVYRHHEAITDEIMSLEQDIQILRGSACCY